MKEIPLTRSMVALVDDDLYPYLSMYKWHAHKEDNRFYAWTHIPFGPRKGKIIRMHQVILEGLPGLLPDHRDGNGINNQLTNLRFCTKSQNSANSKRARNNTSGFKGVAKSPKTCVRPWRSVIMKSGRYMHLGTFDTKKEAAQAYDEAAARLFGPFAKTNAMLGLI